MNIRAIRDSDIPQLLLFTDQEIGKGYYQREELERIVQVSGEETPYPCSFVAFDSKGTAAALRLSWPPRTWRQGRLQRKSHPELWMVREEQVAYFQSLFVAAPFRGQGLGPKLSQMSIDALRSLGATAVVAHSWKESPGNSSALYLLKTGFVPVLEIPMFWEDRDYLCSGCQTKPCQCTAIEMIRQLE